MLCISKQNNRCKRDVLCLQGSLPPAEFSFSASWVSQSTLALAVTLQQEWQRVPHFIKKTKVHTESQGKGNSKILQIQKAKHLQGAVQNESIKQESASKSLPYHEYSLLLKGGTNLLLTMQYSFNQ